MIKNKFIRPPFKVPGSKRYSYSWVIENFPPNYEEMSYVEPYCGAASVLLNKTVSSEEYINDNNPGIFAILKMLRDNLQSFIKKLKKIEYTKDSFTLALNKEKEENYNDVLDFAINEFILRRMSRGGLKQSFAWSNRKRGGNPGDVNAWQSMIKLLPFIAERIKNVFIFNYDAIDIIKAFNNKETLLYIDPPIIEDTNPDSPDSMPIDNHIELLDMLLKFKGKVIIDTFSSTLYKRSLNEWNMKSKKVVGKTKPECLWMNY